MIEFPSWRSSYHFADSLQSTRRYLRETAAENFVQLVVRSSQDHAGIIKVGRKLYRSQRGCEWPADEDGPSGYAPERMKPPRGRGREGRVNPKGIPCLYLATTERTAVAEVRPGVGEYISSGEFMLLRDQRVVDCSRHEAGPIYLFSEPDAAGRAKAVWGHIDQAFSRPITDSDDHAAYVPTQILAEAFRSAGFDGPVYRSSLGDGLNVALFRRRRSRLSQLRSNADWGCFLNLRRGQQPLLRDEVLRALTEAQGETTGEGAKEPEEVRVNASV